MVILPKLLVSNMGDWQIWGNLNPKKTGIFFDDVYRFLHTLRTKTFHFLIKFMDDTQLLG